MCLSPQQNPIETDDSNTQGPDFEDMSSFFPCEMDDAIRYINLAYGAQAPKIINILLSEGNLIRKRVLIIHLNRR